MRIGQNHDQETCNVLCKTVPSNNIDRNDGPLRHCIFTVFHPHRLLQQSLEAVAASMMHYRHTRALSESEVSLLTRKRLQGDAVVDSSYALKRSRCEHPILKQGTASHCLQVLKTTLRRCRRFCLHRAWRSKVCMRQSLCSSFLCPAGVPLHQRNQDYARHRYALPVKLLCTHLCRYVCMYFGTRGNV